jgi:hypothetical protein
MRKVHEILGAASGLHDVVISFIQHGTKEDGFTYENVCPWCSCTVEKVTANPEAEMSRILKRLREGMYRHIWTCTHRNSYRLLVEKATSPLNTEKIIKEM